LESGLLSFWRGAPVPTHCSRGDPLRIGPN
jgi:hypothetical protein